MLQKIDEDLWHSEGHVNLPAGIQLPCRMVVIRLKSGRLWLHSPIKINDTLVQEVADLGRVGHIVAPNCFHHLFVGRWMERFPDAKTYGAMGLDRKRKDLSFSQTLDERTPEAWSDEMSQAFIDGIPALNEFVFLHRASKTLIVTDLLFNVHQANNKASELFLRYVSGAFRKPAQSRLVKLATRNRKAMKQCVQKVLSWDFERIVMAHGEIIESNGPAILRDALSSVLR